MGREEKDEKIMTKKEVDKDNVEEKRDAGEIIVASRKIRKERLNQVTIRNVLS